MNCTDCSADNVSERRYCGQCGKALFNFCSFCGFGNSDMDRFCGGCGRGTQEGDAIQQDISRPSSVQKERLHNPQEQKKFPKAMLEELLGAKEKFRKQEEAGEDSKGPVSQEDIDKMLKEGL